MRENRVIKASVLVFFDAACCARSKILCTVDSPAVCVTQMRRTPSVTIQPAAILSPTVTVRGSDSPVRAAVSRFATPDSTQPSSGILSPGRTSMAAPIPTASTATSSQSPSSSQTIRAVSGRIARSALTDARVRPTARSSSHSPR